MSPGRRPDEDIAVPPLEARFTPPRRSTPSHKVVWCGSSSDIAEGIIQVDGTVDERDGEEPTRQTRVSP